jgi:hypothetical protein
LSPDVAAVSTFCNWAPSWPLESVITFRASAQTCLVSVVPLPAAAVGDGEELALELALLLESQAEPVAMSTATAATASRRRIWFLLLGRERDER